MGFWWLFSCQEGLGQWLRAVLVRRSPNLGGCHCRRITGILCSVHSGLFFLPFFHFFLIPSPHQILRFSLLCLISCWRCLTKGQPLPRQWGWGCCCCFPGALFPPARRPPRAPRPSPPCSGGTGGDPSEGAGPGCLGRDGANTKPKHQDAGLLLWWLCAKELSH